VNDCVFYVEITSILEYRGSTNVEEIHKASINCREMSLASTFHIGKIYKSINKPPRVNTINICCVLTNLSVIRYIQ